MYGLILICSLWTILYIWKSIDIPLKPSKKEIIDYMSETYHIDTSKVYLCGHSLGGMGTTYIASKMPESFAAINSTPVPTSGASVLIKGIA